MVKLGYGTYGMPGENLFEALPRLKEIGYDTVEIAVAPGWAAPEQLTAADRARLRGLLEELGFPAPALLDLLSPLAAGAARDEELRRFRDVCRLAEFLHDGRPGAIVTSTLGGGQPDWESGKERIAEALLELAGMAAEYGVVLAAEPHVGGAWDTPEKAAWMMRHTNHPNLRLNFDISHFAVQGFDAEACVRLCAPYAVHCHVKDGALENGKVRFDLPGTGSFDYRAYFALLRAAGVAAPVTVEVSGMVWKRPDYEPWEAARHAFRALDRARRPDAAGEVRSPERSDDL